MNHLRALAHRLFTLAIRRGFWSAANPVAPVQRFKVPRRLPEYLRAEEVPLVLGALEARWRPLFACALWTGLRRGELLALRKQDVDLSGGTLAVSRSHDADTTKGGHADLLPIARQLQPYLREAIATSPSELLFPNPDGSQQAHDRALTKVLRRAMARAGLVTGHIHKCRRKGCGYEEQRTDSTPERCPRCNMKLWVKGIPRRIRFHDIRHTTATLLLKAGVPLATVQRILRHSDPTITMKVYGHLDLEDMREGIDRLSFPGEAAGSPEQGSLDSGEPTSDAAPAPFAASLLPASAPAKTKALEFRGNRLELQGLLWSGRLDLNQRPLAPQASALPGCATPRKALR